MEHDYRSKIEEEMADDYKKEHGEYPKYKDPIDDYDINDMLASPNISWLDKIQAYKKSQPQPNHYSSPDQEYIASHDFDRY